MRCKICGRECPSGAKICRDCVAARKRAFAVTVTLPLLATAGAPSVAEPRFAPRLVRANPPVVPAVANAPSRPEAPAALPLHVVPRTLAVHWALLGLAMAATIVVLLVKVLAGSSSHATEDHGVAESAVLTPPVAAAPASSLVDAGIGQDATATIKTVNDAPPAKSAAGKPVQRKSMPRADAASVVVAASSPAPDPALVAHAPAPPPRAIEAPRSDPWQAMNEGLSRCAREDLFSRAACEQRLRLQYCPNYWGLVPQCPIGPSNDHGQ